MLSQELFLNSPSLTTMYLKMVFSDTDTVLASGTGFIYEFDEAIYLITNGHNVTGVNPETKKRLSENHCGFPDFIRTNIKIIKEKETDDGIEASKFIGLHPDSVKFDLYEDGELSRPLWLIHPTYGYDVDVVALYIGKKIEIPEYLNLLPINKLPFNNDIPVAVADEVFVLGYPYDIIGTAELPIWKRGSIATEPSVNIDGLPKLLIDTATRPGMSGSPVLYQRSGLINKDNSGIITATTILGTIRGFLGVYSGRIGSKDKFDAQLGIVWKSEVIEEIIIGNKRGTCEFQSF